MIKINELLKTIPKGQLIIIKGWIKTFRANRFIALNDGSCITNIQCVIDFENINEDVLKKITTGACVKLEGALVKSMGKEQSIEIKVDKIKIYGEADPEKYPIQAKKHSLEFFHFQIILLFFLESNVPFLSAMFSSFSLKVDELFCCLFLLEILQLN